MRVEPRRRPTYPTHQTHPTYPTYLTYLTYPTYLTYLTYPTYQNVKPAPRRYTRPETMSVTWPNCEPVW